MGWMASNGGDFLIMFPECIKRGCTLGRDVFYFKLYHKKGIVPDGAHSTTNSFEQKCNRKSTSVKATENGRACTAWVIYNENMDYLHCDDLSWNGKHKCK